jgi:hypothetical protein
MRRLFAIPFVLLTSCALAPEGTDQGEEDLSTTFVYRCSVTHTTGTSPMYIRVSKTRVTYNEGNKDFTKAGGANIASRDWAYVSTSKTPYDRYVWKDPQDARLYEEWKIEPDMLTGGKKMKGGDLGGFAIKGSHGDWYASTDYVCFRTTK